MIILNKCSPCTLPYFFVWQIFVLLVPEWKKKQRRPNWTYQLYSTILHLQIIITSQKHKYEWCDTILFSKSLVHQFVTVCLQYDNFFISLWIFTTMLRPLPQMFSYEVKRFSLCYKASSIKHQKSILLKKLPCIQPLPLEREARPKKVLLLHW